MGAGGNWGFGQDRQERKWAFELNIVVDAIGQYVLNANGGGRMRRSWDEERRQRGKGTKGQRETEQENSSRHYMHEECAFLG